MNYTPYVLLAALLFAIWKLIIQPRINEGKPIHPDPKKKKKPFNFQDYVQPLKSPADEI